MKDGMLFNDGFMCGRKGRNIAKRRELNSRKQSIPQDRCHIELGRRTRQKKRPSSLYPRAT
jgi:hypothetical protein